MRNFNVHKKYPGGSSIIKKTEETPGKSGLEAWVRGLRSVGKNPKDPVREDKRQELITQEHDTGSKSEDERWQACPPTSLWRDDGGEGGEAD